jgi:tRNA G18 (ribose-2'-O)-methylase SpoU
VIQYLDRHDDPRIAAYAEVGDHERIRARGLFVAEGRLVCRRLIESRRFDVDSVVVTPAALHGLSDLLEAVDWPVYVCGRDVVQTLTGIDFHRGCLALARRPAAPLPLSHFAGARRLLALEDVGNPDNLGGLFRVGAAFGVDGVLLAPSCADPFYRKSIRTSVGHVLRVPFTAIDRWPGELEGLRGSGFRIVALSPDASATPLRDFAAAIAPDCPAILMLGGEGSGLTREAMNIADHIVRIPMAAGVDSLNVTVAAGIALAFLDGGACPPMPEAT